jgi:hypothetical protein
MKVIDGSLCLRWLNVICETFNVLTVEQRRKTGLEKKLDTILLTNSMTLYVFAGHYQTTAVVYTSSMLERGLKNVSVLCVLLQAQQL